MFSHFMKRLISQIGCNIYTKNKEKIKVNLFSNLHLDLLLFFTLIVYKSRKYKKNHSKRVS